VARHTRDLTDRAIAAALEIPGLTVYGPPPGAPRSPLLSFNVAGIDPVHLSRGLDQRGIESRAGCHCATLAHRDLGLTPPASCRLSFALYSSTDDVDRAMDALREVVRRHGEPDAMPTLGARHARGRSHAGVRRALRL
jgi:cysteine desulfurase/selenocysteine lyase